MSGDLTALLSDLPKPLRVELVESFALIERNYREHRWEPSELNGGKLCEIVYSILKGYVDGSFPITASKPPNMVDACRGLENASTSFPRSVRIQIPRMLLALYEIRNNRGVGHVGGDVDPNEMDATCVLQMAKWVLAELIRVFHDVSTLEAQAAVNALSERELTLVWEVGGKLRVLDTSLKISEQTMILLYSRTEGMEEKELLDSVEYSNASNYRRDVLKKLHKKRWIEYNQSLGIARISPLGSSHVEASILTNSA